MKIKIILFSIVIVAVACGLLGISTYLGNKRIVETAQADDFNKQTAHGNETLNAFQNRVNGYLEEYVRIAETLAEKMMDNEAIIALETEEILLKRYSFHDGGDVSTADTDLYKLFEETWQRHSDRIDYIFWMDREKRTLTTYPGQIDGFFDVAGLKPGASGPYFTNFSTRKPVEQAYTALARDVKGPSAQEQEDPPLTYTANLVLPTPFQAPFQTCFLLLGIRLDGLNDLVVGDRTGDAGAASAGTPSESVRLDRYVCDPNGLILFHSDPDKVHAIAEPPETSQRRFRQQADLSYFNWRAGVAKTLSLDFFHAADGMRQSLTRTILVFSVFSMVVAVGLAYLISRSFIQPLLKLERGAAVIAEGDLDHLVDVRTHDEIGKLATSFNIMTGRLKDAFQRIEAENSRLEKELEEAHDLQMSLVPQVVPEFPGIQLGGMLIPAREVGGDYFDFIIQNDQLNIVVADSSGKGFAGAFSIALTRGVFRTYMGGYGDKSVSATMADVDMGVSQQMIRERVTMVLANYNPRTRELVFSNAGHSPPIFFRRSDRSCQRLKIAGHVLNSPLEADQRPREYQEKRLSLEQGDIVAFYSDGLVEESANGQRFGFDRLMVAVSDHAEDDAETICRKIYDRLRDFSGKDREYGDDVTLVVMKMA